MFTISLNGGFTFNLGRQSDEDEEPEELEVEHRIGFQPNEES